MKSLRKSYLDLLRKLQFDTNDTSDSALCGSHGTLRNILELICNEPVEFNLRLDHGLNEDVQEWLIGSDKVELALLMDIHKFAIVRWK